jgi:hypothetical protein
VLIALCLSLCASIQLSLACALCSCSISPSPFMCSMSQTNVKASFQSRLRGDFGCLTAREFHKKTSKDNSLGRFSSTRLILFFSRSLEPFFLWVDTCLLAISVQENSPRLVCSGLLLLCFIGVLVVF